MRKHKDSAWNEFQKIPTNERFSYAMSRDKIYSDKEFILKLNNEKKLTNNLKNNSKGFYSYLRNKQQLKTGVPTLEKPDGSHTASASESAEVLADAFRETNILFSYLLQQYKIKYYNKQNSYNNSLYTVHTINIYKHKFSLCA